MKDTTLSPDLIDLNLKEGSGWVIDKNASTKERTILYYTGILPAGKSTPALSDTLTIDGSIATKVKQDVTEKDGYKTITTTYAYDGYNFQLEAEADAVQTHNAQAVSYTHLDVYKRQDVTVTDTLTDEVELADQQLQVVVKDENGRVITKLKDASGNEVVVSEIITIKTEKDSNGKTQIIMQFKSDYKLESGYTYYVTCLLYTSRCV